MRNVRGLRADLRRLIRNLGVLRARYPELGLGVSQCHTLLELETGTRALGELSEVLHLDPSSASRNLATLARHGYVSHQRDAKDPRRKLFRLTAKGRKQTRAVHRHGDTVMRNALAYLAPSEQQQVATSLASLATAVARSQVRGVDIRRSRKADEPAIARVIRSVLEELEMTQQDTAYKEPSTDRIHRVYTRARGAYFVVCLDGVVEGGGGILPHTATTCELKNLYFSPRVRGGGHARRLMNEALDFAQRRGFRRVFLETRSGWDAAEGLYRLFGFKRCDRPSFYTGHTACDRYWALDLEPRADT